MYAAFLTILLFCLSNLQAAGISHDNNYLGQSLPPFFMHATDAYLICKFSMARN